MDGPQFIQPSFESYALRLALVFLQVNICCFSPVNLSIDILISSYTEIIEASEGKESI